MVGVIDGGVIIIILWRAYLSLKEHLCLNFTLMYILIHTTISLSVNGFMELNIDSILECRHFYFLILFSKLAWAST